LVTIRQFDAVGSEEFVQPLLITLLRKPFGSIDLFALVIRFLKVGDKVRYHPANLPAKVVQLPVFAVLEVFLVPGDLKLGAYFSAGSLGDIEKLNEFGLAASFRALEI
jgi:hypothetical protein